MAHEAILHTINSVKGYQYIQIRKGDIFLIDCSKSISTPDFESLNEYERDQYELVFELIVDRENYEKSISGSTYLKPIRLKDIRAIRRFEDVAL